MKKHLYIILVLLVLIILTIGFIFINNNTKTNSTANKDKTYTYEKEGFGGDFTITIRTDGTSSFYEGYLSSYMGEGTWKIEDNILIISDSMFTNKFKMYDNKIEFIEEGSSNFPYIKVQDGENFILNK